ncbi:MAG: hypothetical protein M3174_00435 [Actinomycetota bacterium]|nr:hypothetical protein [Actinomycetota bacterium]
MSRPLMRLCPAILSLFLALPAPPTAAAGALSSGETARLHEVDDPASKTRRFWTEERMLAAENNDRAAGDASGSSTLSDGDGGIPYTREEISTDGDSAYITHGRIFFRSEGRSYTCSGTVITTDNRSVVWTAGHCVNHGGDRWANKWIFVPGYDDGEAPYGKWTAQTLAAPRGWINHGSSAYDIGAAILNPNARGEYIADVVGSLGIAWNLPRRQEFTVYGYPAAGLFTGGSLWACRSAYGWSDPIPGPNPLAVGCNLPYGSSGGGWVVELSDGLYLNSVTSYSHVGERHVVYGPYFGDAAASLYERVSG